MKIDIIDPNELPDYAKDILMSDGGLTEDEAERAIEDFESN